MNIYDVLRKLVEARPWQDYERQEAITIISEAERMGVFGTTAVNIREDHEHDWIPGLGYSYSKMICRVCRQEKEMNPIEQRQGLR